MSLFVLDMKNHICPSVEVANGLGLPCSLKEEKRGIAMEVKPSEGHGVVRPLSSPSKY